MSLIKSLPFLPQDDQPYQGALWELSKGDRRAIPVLVQLLKDDDPEIRMMVLWAIESIGSRLGPAARKEAAPALVEALKDEDDRVRLLAAWALRNVSPENTEAVPVLIETLNDKQNPYRQFAISNLSEMGPNAKDAVPALIEALKEDDDSTQFWVIRALG